MAGKPCRALKANPLWNPYPGRNGIENSAFPPLCCGFGGGIVLCFTSQQLGSHFHHSCVICILEILGLAKGWTLGFLLAGIQGDIHMDNLTCSLDLGVFLKTHLEPHTSHTHSQGLCLTSAGCQCLKSMKKLFLGFLTRLGDKPISLISTDTLGVAGFEHLF